ncbi:MAG: tyrosine-type recombinase/integrase [Oscillospiraceae bacterium]|nr:tyrosine-type recombinase/integrase [Oscillospiraceae bacterium]
MIELDKEITIYLNYCKYQKKLSKDTVKAYTIDLKQFQRHISPVASCIAKPEITCYITHLHKTYQPKTVKRKLASLKAFFSHLEFEEIIPDDPMRKIKTKFQEPQELPRTIPLKAIKKILAVAYRRLEQAHTPYGFQVAHRDVAVVELLFATGMRVSELCSLNADDVNLSDGSIRIMGKGSKERVLQIGNREVLALLRHYRNTHLAVMNETGYFFVNRLQLRLSEQSVRTLIRRFCAEAGISLHITPHMFRHSFATLLLEEDVDIRYIQRMLGHSSIQTTQIYTQVTAQKQRKILASKHPRNKFVFNE